MAPLSTLLVTERIVADLQRAGERSLIIGDRGQFFFEPTGDRVVRISSKDSAAACIAAIEATLNPNVIQQQQQQQQQQQRRANKKWLSPASVGCVVVEPDMKTRNLQKVFPLRRLRVERRALQIALVEQATHLQHINGALDDQVSLVLLHAAHAQFDEQLRKLEQRFCGTACFDKQLPAKLHRCVGDFRRNLGATAGELHKYWLAVRLEHMHGECEMVEQCAPTACGSVGKTTVAPTAISDDCMEVAPVLHQCSLSISQSVPTVCSGIRAERLDSSERLENEDLIVQLEDAESDCDTRKNESSSSDDESSSSDDESSSSDDNLSDGKNSANELSSDDESATSDDESTSSDNESTRDESTSDESTNSDNESTSDESTSDESTNSDDESTSRDDESTSDESGSNVETKQELLLIEHSREEEQQRRHLEIIDTYIEKLQRKRAAAAEQLQRQQQQQQQQQQQKQQQQQQASSQQTTSLKKRGWLSWLLPW